MKARYLAVVIALVATGCSSPTAPPMTHGPGPLEPVLDGPSWEPGQTADPARVVTEPRTVSPFDSVSLAGVGRLVIQQTGVESLTLTADEDLLSLLTSEVRGGCLYLSVAQNNGFQTTHEITWRLSVANLDEIRLVGAAQAEARGLRLDELSIVMNGATRLEVTGSVLRQRLTIMGASAYRGEQLQSRETSLDVSGASHAVVRVDDLLTGRVTGPSLVEYAGDPEVSVSVSGTARVQRL